MTPLSYSFPSENKIFKAIEWDPSILQSIKDYPEQRHLYFRVSSQIAKLFQNKEYTFDKFVEKFSAAPIWQQETWNREFIGYIRLIVLNTATVK